jgi:hypothetical protein
MPRTNVTIGGRVLALDARPDRLDLRDLPFRPPLGNLPERYPTETHLSEWLPAYAEADLVLDQGAEGACTGFGLAAVINYLLFVRGKAGKAARRVSPAMLYQLARIYDEWPGEDYDGSSCRGALKGWHRHGVCRDALWPYLVRRGKRVFVQPHEDPEQRDDPATNWDVDALATILGVYYRIDARSVVDMQAAIQGTGAIYVSATVHEGWNVKTRKTVSGHDDLVRITPVPKPRDAGGHAFALVGYNELGFVVQNSWGPGWGSRGFALLPYEDWVTHGEDAWAFTLGVPRHEAVMERKGGGERVLRSPRFVPPSGDADTSGIRERPIGLVGAGDDAFARRYRQVPEHLRPLDADAAYQHAVVLDRGFPVRNDVTAVDAEAAVLAASYTRPSAWLQAQRAHKVLIYAHGGLNSEGAAIARARALAPYALDNGIYPMFVVWRSGALETVSDLVEEVFAKLGFGDRAPARGWLDRITDKTDRMLEPLLRVPGSAMWEQMKLNAQRASAHDKGGVRLMCDGLKTLSKDVGNLEIHLVGHSAGAILLGSMLQPLRAHELGVSSLRLYAPACTSRFALDTYKPAVDKGQVAGRHLHIHTLSDKNEQGDSVGPYRKSLLYLVSRSFEDQHKTPILGLDTTFDPATIGPGQQDNHWAPDRQDDVRKWIAFWDGLGLDATNRHVLAKGSVSTGAGSIDASHGCFDNAVEIVGDTLGYVVNPKAPSRVKVHRLDYD